MSEPSSGRLTYNLGNDRGGRPVFLTRDGEHWWKLRMARNDATAPGSLVQIELSIEQISMIAQVAKA